MASLNAYYEGGPKTWNEAFPPVCLTTHWDPTALTNHVLPQQAQRNLALDPRPSAKICTEYYDESAGDATLNTSTPPPPEIPAALRGINAPPQPQHKPSDYALFPPGGAASYGFPYQGYETQVNAESDLQRLDEPLTRCAEKRYIPRGGLPAQGVSIKGQAGCRNQDDQAAWDRSARLFFNPTRYDRTTMVPKNLYTAQARSELLCHK